MSHQDRKIQNALRIIFGPGHSRYQLPEITLLKQAYRKQAMRYHPDRSKFHGQSEISLEEKFKHLSDAYNLLVSLIESGTAPKYIRKAYTSYNHTSGHYHAKHHTSHKPRFKMRLAFFLYRKGLIDWDTAIDALIWQTSHRPRVGEIGIKCKYLEREQIYQILKNRLPREKFCRAAERCGMLDAFKTRVILYVQRSYNLPIGRYFIEKNILTEEEITALVAELKEYNRRFF